MSFNELRRRLDPLFIKRLEQQFDVHTIDRIINGFSTEKLPVVRINTLKTDVQNIMRYFKEMNVLFERISFLPNALIVRNKSEKFFEKLEIYENGKIYFQGISSQLPAIFLAPRPGEKVLDMAAAPGSKTAQIGIMMGNRGEILANEINQIRFERLKYNLDKQGIKVATTNLGDGTVLGEKFPNYFDKVLLDAPCSAEGRICLNDQKSYRFWSEKNIRQNVKIQKKLFESAVKALKPGGVLVYSTCTLAPEENEMVVDWALKTFGDILKIEKIDLDFKYKLPVLGAFSGVSFDLKVKHALKAMPSEISEGFFIAGFRRV
ncbi:MAG: RsmB/NOP family class I SAM-dependent RNA methyltransferase [Candidatus Gracilibacteria bacterium]|jgi:16S rRNA (cytosine1407-C5)-methyltransferase